MSSISLKNIKKVYDGGVVAVNDFNLEIEDKEFSESESEQSLHGFLMTPEGIELASLFPHLTPKQRRRILELVRTLTDDDQD